MLLVLFISNVTKVAFRLTSISSFGFDDWQTDWLQQIERKGTLFSGGFQDLTNWTHTAQTSSEGRIAIAIVILFIIWRRVFHVIYQTRETVFHRISKHREESWKYDAQRSIFDKIRGVWIVDETLSRVFDISSQSKLELKRKRRNKIVKIYANWDQISKHRHGHDFLCLNLMNY